MDTSYYVYVLGAFIFFYLFFLLFIVPIHIHANAWNIRFYHVTQRSSSYMKCTVCLCPRIYSNFPSNFETKRLEPRTHFVEKFRLFIPIQWHFIDFWKGLRTKRENRKKSERVSFLFLFFEYSCEYEVNMQVIKVDFRVYSVLYECNTMYGCF